MSRWPNPLAAIGKAARRPVLRAPSGKTPASGFPSRTTIWLDGERARLLERASRADHVALLTTPGDTAAALAALDTLAPKPGRPGLEALCVVAGAPFARYHVLPWQPFPKPDEWISMARMQAIQTGAGSEPWRYAIADAAWGRSRLAAALPEALCAGIGRLCKARRLRIAGIETGYAFALHRHARRIRDGAIAIVMLEERPGGAAIAQIGMRRGGAWSGFIALPVTGALDDVLRDAFVLLASAPPERCYVIGPGAAERWVADPASVQWLPAPWDTTP